MYSCCWFEENVAGPSEYPASINFVGADYTVILLFVVVVALCLFLLLLLPSVRCLLCFPRFVVARLLLIAVVGCCFLLLVGFCVFRVFFCALLSFSCCRCWFCCLIRVVCCCVVVVLLLASFGFLYQVMLIVFVCADPSKDEQQRSGREHRTRVTMQGHRRVFCHSQL